MGKFLVEQRDWLILDERYLGTYSHYLHLILLQGRIENKNVRGKRNRPLKTNLGIKGNAAFDCNI